MIKYEATDWDDRLIGACENGYIEIVNLVIEKKGIAV